ncbi:hypothetical protein ZWY2020_042174 [Hordeum vulgare]|nr:hypothetical protein ZWY2020_042174 [Hordeum vulgare]
MGEGTAPPGKRNCVDDETEAAMLEVLVHHHNKGDHSQNGWKAHVYTATIKNVKEKCNKDIVKDNILRRLRTFDKQYEVINKTLSQSAFGWYWVNHKLLIDSDDVWTKYVEKSLPSYKTKVVKPLGSHIYHIFKDHADGEGAKTDAGKEGHALSPRRPRASPQFVVPARARQYHSPLRFLGVSGSPWLPQISPLILPEFNSFDHLINLRYISTDRPWLKFHRLTIQQFEQWADLALIHQCLPDELLIEIFGRMSPYTLGRAACVCQANFRMVQSLYASSWRKMWVQRPRIRIDGLYVSRNTYIHTGITEWQFKKTVNVVCYYRYLRFFPTGKFLYKKVKDVVKCMHLRASKGDSVFKGDYTLSGDGQIEMALLYPGHRYTLVRMRLRYFDFILFIGNILELVEDWEENETHDPDVPAVSHSRGLTPFVFVPFEEADTSVLNLPVEKMDYFVPG